MPVGPAVVWFCMMHPVCKLHLDLGPVGAGEKRSHSCTTADLCPMNDPAVCWYHCFPKGADVDLASPLRPAIACGSCFPVGFRRQCYFGGADLGLSVESCLQLLATGLVVLQGACSSLTLRRVQQRRHTCGPARAGHWCKGATLA